MIFSELYKLFEPLVYQQVLILSFLVQYIVYLTPILHTIRYEIGLQDREENWWIFRKISNVLDCSKCLGFWIGLLFFQSFLMGIITSITSIIIEKILDTKYL